jgi:hypothetical protein
MENDSFLMNNKVYPPAHEGDVLVNENSSDFFTQDVDSCLGSTNLNEQTSVNSEEKSR